MKKFIALLFILAAVAALLFGLWKIARGSGVSESSGGSRNSLYARSAERVGEYAAKFYAGWNDTVFANAQSYIDGRSRDLHAADMRTLRDKFAGECLVNLAAYIRRSFPNVSTPGYISGDPHLRSAYAGLDTLCRHYPAVKQSDTYTQLENDRIIYNKIYAFSVKAHPVSSNLNPVLSLRESGYKLTSNDLFDYDAYAVTQNRIRGELEHSWSDCGDLRHVRWIPAALKRDRLDERIAGSRSNYHAAVRRSLTDFYNTYSSANNPLIFSNDIDSGELARLSDMSKQMYRMVTSQTGTDSSLLEAHNKFHESLRESARRFD